MHIGIMAPYTVEPPYNESIGITISFIEEYANGTLDNFTMRGFSLFGEFIITLNTVTSCVEDKF